MLAARKVPGAAEVDRGPAREPDVGRAGPPRARHRQHGLRRRRRDARRRDRPRAGRRRLPDAVAGRHLGRGRDAVPGPVPDPGGHLGHDLGVLQHARPHRLPGPVGVRVGRPRGAARHRRPAHGHRPGRAAPPQLPRRRRPARTSNAIGMPYDHMSPREVFEAALEKLDYDAFRREQAAARARGPLPRRRHQQLRRADHHRHGLLRHRGRHDPHRAVAARSTCTSPAARPGTASRPRPCSSPPTPSASTSTTSTRSRATPPSPPSGSAPAAAAAGR